MLGSEPHIPGLELEPYLDTGYKLCLGDRVRNDRTGETGRVIPAGPYGDEPFQILLDSGDCQPFVHEDGSMSYRPCRWINEL